MTSSKLLFIPAPLSVSVCSMRVRFHLLTELINVGKIKPIPILRLSPLHSSPQPGNGNQKVPKRP